MIAVGKVRSSLGTICRSNVIMVRLPLLNWAIVRYSWYWAFGALGIVGLAWCALWLAFGGEGPLAAAAVKEVRPCLTITSSHREYNRAGQALRRVCRFLPRITKNCGAADRPPTLVPNPEPSDEKYLRGR
jgi:hypothetical protein